ncbi:tyrosine-type recombinase/integrase [Methylovulum psychrotolerans]|uniref:tyrosine-type recombinase/integrase n=1 Tax=Methylovulum psychrotolerans TaxID=1704499 RepID=UPI001BFF017B|nr:site-specific integrase [Methylovulum psychrotolerans]MBT9098774.1 tyrosine-type recombinase/integrase [Methylovulum psychrotolerans]
MSNLSDIQIRTWIKNNERFEARSDSDGLYLRFRQVDTVPVWRFRYRFAGKQRVMVIGNYGQMSLAEARKVTKELKARVALGNDVAAEKQDRKADAVAKMEAKNNAFTVGQLADDYFNSRVLGKWKHPNIVRARIENDIKPNIGKLAIEDVKPSHIDLMLKAIIKRGAPTMANDVLRWTRRLFDHAIKRNLLQYNPASAFDLSDAGGKETARSRALTRADLVALFEAMRNTKGFTQVNIITVRLLLMLAVRKNELIAARKSEFDLSAGLWHLPAERNKTESAITIPLPRQAIEALETLHRLSETSDWLLPARKAQDRMLPHIHENTLNVALAKVKPNMPDVEAFCIHDFRRTARTHLAALGIPSHIAERCLNHKIKGVEGIYNRHDYLDERREALKLWANLLESCETGQNWNVTPIRKQA